MLKKQVKYLIRSLFTASVWLVGLLLCYIGLLLVLSRHPQVFNKIPNLFEATGRHSHTLTRFIDYEASIDEDLDVLFIGSSHVYRGFDPRNFESHGISSFGLGTRAQSPMNTYYLLEHYIDSLSAETIVLDTFWYTASLGGKESTIDLSTNMEIVSSHAKMALASGDLSAINSVLMNFLLQNTSNNLSDEYDRQKDIVKDYYVHGGYIDSQQRTNQEEIADKLIDTEITINQKQVEYTEKIIRLAQKHDKDIVLIRIPVTQELLGVITNYDDTNKPFAQLAREYGLNYYDFNDESHFRAMGLELEKHFYDDNHLNSYGVDIFNDYFLNYLNKEISKSV